MFSPSTFASKATRVTRAVYVGVLSFFAFSFVSSSNVYANAQGNTRIQSVQNESVAQRNTALPFDSSVAAPAGAPTGATAGATAGATIDAPPVVKSNTTPEGALYPQKMAQQDFDLNLLALREASMSNDDAVAVPLSSRLLALSSFPATTVEVAPLLRAYIEYFGIKPLLFDAAGSVREEIPEDTLQKVRGFLRRYAGSALADRMRNDYLLVLGAQKDWDNFEAHRRLFTLGDDVKVKIYALAARAQRGENVAAAARALLVDPRQYGNAGIDLITLLAEQKQFSAQDIWGQMRLTYRVNRHSMAKEIAKALGADAPASYLLDEAALRPLILLTDSPHTVNAVNAPNTAMGPQLILLALTQMARYNPRGAATAFAPLAPQLTANQRAIGWLIIAHWGAVDRCPEALHWYSLTKGAHISNNSMEWRARAALFAGSWKEVRAAIETMPAALQAQPTWVYWLARALQEPRESVALAGNATATNPNASASSLATSTAQNQARAKALFTKIASGFDFYGLLAREALGRSLVLPERAIVTPAEVAAMSQRTGFALTQRLYAAGLYFEGSREWNWLLRGMGDRQLVAAAHYAKQQGLYDRAVNTADRTRREHDFSLRYPTPSLEIVTRNAKDADVDLNWVYGLIRQESRFLTKAQSGVGAVGLMQVMPRTAQLVVRKIGLDGFELEKLADIQSNTQIGTRYLDMLYEQFDGSEVLATAGYNAGPRRAKKWQEALSRTLEGAIFIETIPFDETRTYVKNVLANALYYDAILSKEGRNRHSLLSTLGQITPSSPEVQITKDLP